MLFLCSGPHDTPLSNAVKKVAVLKYHSHDVVACDENGHASSHFQATRSDGSPDGLGLALKGNPLLKREALSKIKLPLSLLSL